MAEFVDVVIEHLDGTSERVELVTREHIADGVLHLFKRESVYGPFESHLGSWPLCSIKKWRRFRR